jgi:hypothetical protein
MITEGTKMVLRLLMSRWREAADCERDSRERAAFSVPSSMLERMLKDDEATHEDIRKFLPSCPGYPNFGRATLRGLADAERDGREVVVTTGERGGIRWTIAGEPNP